MSSTARRRGPCRPATWLARRYVEPSAPRTIVVRSILISKSWSFAATCPRGCGRWTRGRCTRRSLPRATHCSGDATQHISAYLDPPDRCQRRGRERSRCRRAPMMGSRTRRLGPLNHEPTRMRARRAERPLFWRGWTGAVSGLIGALVMEQASPASGNGHCTRPDRPTPVGRRVDPGAQMRGCRSAGRGLRAG